MLPHDLKPEQFRSYPPDARKLAVDYLGTLQKLPLAFLPSLLREAIEYDYKFPVERKALEQELAMLAGLSSGQLGERLQAFEHISISPQLERADWVNAPAQFVEQLSAHLWSTHQQDAFRKAALEYADRLREATPPEPLPTPRLGIAVIGQGVNASSEPLFRKLRPHGVYFKRVKPENGMQLLLNAVADRAKAHPAPYGHWYVDGGAQMDHDPALICVSYKGLETARAELLRRMQAEIDRPGMGPETLRSVMAKLHPSDLGVTKEDAVLGRFEVKVLTEGSGTQIFSTTFAQWTAREALRRAQPLTLMVRFAPRQRQKPMNELLTPVHNEVELDPAGSLLDADMGAYYNWLNQQRLPGAEQSSFLAWFEDHNEAVAIAPSLPRGTESTTSGDLRTMLSWMT